MVAAKQSVDLHTNSYGQYLAAEYLKTGHLKKHLPKILKIYKSRQEAMLKALEKYFPTTFRWTYPEGGMFIWLTGPKNFDAIKLYWKAIKKNVAFVPGTYFFAKPGEGKNTMRLNFTNVSEKQIDIAIKKLSEVIKQI
jgi:2-aminoadipate transaminase